MHHHLHSSSVAKVAPFDTLLGVTDGGVQVFSCDYDTADKDVFRAHEAFVAKHNGVFTGIKWQCVELARRYWLVNYGYVFESIPMAYDILSLESARCVEDETRAPLKRCLNGGPDRPEKGSLMIWKDCGEFVRTGHVAVVVNVTDTFVDIVEQNVDDEVWPEGVNYSRRLPAVSDPATGSYTVSCTFPDSEVLGWVTLAEGPVHAGRPADVTRADLEMHVAHLDHPEDNTWLDPTDRKQAAFIEAYGDRLSSSTTAEYLTLTHKGLQGLQQATRELHTMFRFAMDHVIHSMQDTKLTSAFGIPPGLWHKIRRSWFRNNQDTVCGRFDFCLTDTGVKVYEYNADSASALFECGYVQDRWAQAAGLGEVGTGSGACVAEELEKTWRRLRVAGVLHLWHDADKEEEYHTLYMKSIAEAAGISCKIVSGSSVFTWSAAGDILDADGLVVRNVWKTWSWSTALAELEASPTAADDGWAMDFELKDIRDRPDVVARVGGKPARLFEVLLHPAVRVFEPLWTVVMSSKALLPVLWQLYPDHPYLLPSTFERTADMLEHGYVAKPVLGRCGQNVLLFDKGGQLLEEKDGRFGSDTFVYQGLCLLPRFGRRAVQINTFVTRGDYLGPVVRSEEDNIMQSDSAVLCLRLLP